MILLIECPKTNFFYKYVQKTPATTTITTMTTMNKPLCDKCGEEHIGSAWCYRCDTDYCTNCEVGGDDDTPAQEWICDCCLEDVSEGDQEWVEEEYCQKCDEKVPLNPDHMWVQCTCSSHPGWYCGDHSPGNDCYGDEDCDCCNPEEPEDVNTDSDSDEEICCKCKQEDGQLCQGCDKYICCDCDENEMATCEADGYTYCNDCFPDDEDDYNKWTKAKLHTLCEQRGYKKYKKLNKGPLIDFIKNKEGAEEDEMSALLSSLTLKDIDVTAGQITFNFTPIEELPHPDFEILTFE